MIRILAILFLTCACVYSQAQVNFIETIAGTGVQGYGGDGGLAINAKFDHANDLCLDNFGNLYISDAFNNRIRKIVISTGVITTIAGNGTGGFSGDGSPATDAQLLIPQAICTDDSGNIYIGDALNHRIRKVTVSTGIITTIVGNGIVGNSGDGGPAINANINIVAGLSLDKFGNLYLNDAVNNNIRKITTAGIISTIAGNGTPGFSGDGGLAIHAQLNRPNRVTTDTFGNIIFGDGFNHVIRKVNPITGIISSIAGNGTAGYSGDSGPASNAKLSYPGGVFTDQWNNIFVVEAGNGTVRKIDGATGIITTLVGCGILGFAGDGGPATDAKLKPTNLVLDTFGTMYIADYENNRIRKVYNPQLATTFPGLHKGTVTVSPNPAKDELIIEYCFTDLKDAEFHVSDVTGRLIIQKDLSSNKEKEELDIRSLSPGMYIYSVMQNGMLVSTGKIVKE